MTAARTHQQDQQDPHDRDGFIEIFQNTMAMRWGDMDAFGHINNTVYFRYMEQLRIDWFESIGVPMPAGQGAVIATATMHFRHQLRYPGRIVCRLLARPPGRSSVETRFELRREDDTTGKLYAEGGARIVWIDHAAEKSVPLPDVVRRKLPQPIAD